MVWCKRKWWACSFDFALHLSCLSRVPLNWACQSNTHVWLTLFPLNACLVIARVSVTLFWDLHKTWCCSFVGSIAKLHQARYTTANKRTKKSAHPPSWVKFCTLTPKIGQYYHILFHSATVTAVQMAAPVPEIIDTSSNTCMVFSFSKLTVLVKCYSTCSGFIPEVSHKHWHFW
jgi:hypothetical protein